jgi:hypothetical protein
MTKKRVSFMAHGRRVTFYTKSASKRRTPIRKKLSRASSGRNYRRNYKIRRDAEKFVETGLALVYPAAPVVIAGARLVKDILDT